MDPNGKSALTISSFLYLFVLYFQRRSSILVLFQSENHTAGPLDHGHLQLQGAFSVQKDHRIARFEEFLLTCDTRCFSMFFFNYTTGTQQESAQHAQFLHLHLFHTHIFCPLVVDQSGSLVDLMESRLALRKSAGGTVVTSSDMGETSSISPSDIIALFMIFMDALEVLLIASPQLLYIKGTQVQVEVAWLSGLLLLRNTHRCATGQQIGTGPTARNAEQHGRREAGNCPILHRRAASFLKEVFHARPVIDANEIP